VTKTAHTIEPDDEAIERNAINYTPFKGFSEIRDLARHHEFSTLFANYVANLEAKSTLDEFLTDLQGLASDPDCKYFARTLLRLALAGEILLLIRAASAAVESEWMTMNQRWQTFLTGLFPDPNPCYLLKFVPLIGTSLS
jgi:hypothetical protein